MGDRDQSTGALGDAEPLELGCAVFRDDDVHLVTGRGDQHLRREVGHDAGCPAVVADG